MKRDDVSITLCPPDHPFVSAPAQEDGPPALWMLLLVRMVTRVAFPRGGAEDEDGDEEAKEGAREEMYAQQDRLRQVLCEWIVADFPARFARCRRAGCVDADGARAGSASR
jgi:hypothetical protein